MIKHSEVWRRMNAGEVFSMVFVTLNKKLKKGGQLRTLENAQKNNANMVTLGAVPDSAGLPRTAPESKAPNHHQHGTINIKCADKSLVKVHTRLITKFNGEDVAL